MSFNVGKYAVYGPPPSSTDYQDEIPCSGHAHLPLLLGGGHTQIILILQTQAGSQ